MFVSEQDIEKLVDLDNLSVSIQQKKCSKYLKVEQYQLLFHVWNALTKLKFNEQRKHILMRYAFLETCFRLNTNNVLSTNSMESMENGYSNFYLQKAFMVFKNIDVKVLNKAIANPEELPRIFYQQSRAILPRKKGDLIDAIIVIILSKCHIDHNDVHGNKYSIEKAFDN